MWPYSRLRMVVMFLPKILQRATAARELPDEREAGGCATTNEVAPFFAIVNGLNPGVSLVRVV